MTTNYLIAANRLWISNLIQKLNACTDGDFHLITQKSELMLDFLNQLRPKWIFFAHWPHIIPREIHEKFKCVVFHMTDLPFGRGGSPLQNLIASGFSETKISALLCTEDLDAGPIFLKKKLSLQGNAEKIYKTATMITAKMIKEIIENDISPAPQVGLPTYFKRRKPSESNISTLNTISSIYDWIRMLDAEGYPAAFLETEYLHLTFTNAELINDEVTATVKIKLK